jgi:hypothetical protein
MIKIPANKINPIKTNIDQSKSKECDIILIFKKKTLIYFNKINPLQENTILQVSANVYLKKKRKLMRL